MAAKKKPPGRADAKSARSSLKRSEWDFSEWNDWDLPDGLEYELARSNPRVRTNVEAVLGMTVMGKTLREHLYEANEAESEPDGLWEAVFREGKTFRICPVRSFAWDHPFFPHPWSDVGWSLNPDYRPEAPRGIDLFDINDPKDPIGRDPEAITNWVKVVGKEPRCRTAVITIDLEAKPKKADIKARFDEWLDKNYHGAPRGKAGKGSKTIPWHKLRDLAALRLNEAGFKYPDAQKFLSAEMKNRKGKPISNGTWPIYRNDNRGTENPGGWSNALKRARDEIAKVADRIKLLP